MSVQVRRSEGDPRLFSPDRDVAHLFRPAMLQVAAWIEDGTWPVLAEFLSKNSLEADALGHACAKMCQCMGSGSQKEYHAETCVESLTRSGFLDEPIEAQLAVLASLGAVFVGVTHKGLREATIAGEGPLKSISELLDTSERLLNKFYGRNHDDA